MKNITVLLISLVACSTAFAQIVEEVSRVSPFHEGLAAVKKDNQWAFINGQGEKTIDYRDDIVLSVGNNGMEYPYFKEGRCLIKQTVDGVDFYGFIDKTGKRVIAPEFVNATNFTHGHAIIVNIEKYQIGTNPVLGKDIYNQVLEEYVIDTSGKIVKYLYNPRKCSLKRLQDRNIPCFESKIIAPNLVAVKNKVGKWDIHKF